MTSIHLGALLERDPHTETYAAFDQELGREVIVQRLQPEVAGDAVLQERFRRLAQLLGQVQHRHVIRLYREDEGGATGDRTLVLERVQGPTLKEWSRAHGPLPAPLVLVFGIVLGRVMEDLHDHGIVHRGLTSLVVLLDTLQGRLVLSGFLFALVPKTRDTPEITQAGEMIGTLGYAPPEQVRGEPVDEHADVYSLGALLYELLTGGLPFACGSLEEYLAAIERQDYAPPLGLNEGRGHPALTEVLEGCLRRDPDERLPLGEALSMLERALREVQFDDAEVELQRCLLDPKAYLTGLGDRLVAVHMGAALTALGEGHRAEAAEEAESALAWRPSDPEITAFLQALPTIDPKEIEGLRQKFALGVPGDAPPAGVLGRSLAGGALPGLGLGLGPGSEKRAPAAHARWRRGLALVAGLAVGASGLTALLHRRFESPVQATFARVVQLQRPGPVQFTYRLLSEYRPYPIDDPARPRPETLRLDLEALERLKKRGDLHAVCSAWVADGSPGTLAQAQTCLDELAPPTDERGIVKLSVTPSPLSDIDIDSDRAAILILLGKPGEALWIIAGVLLTQPDHAAAQWNRALALQDLGLTVTAAEAFRRIEERGIPGWSTEAHQRREALERVDEEKRRTYEDVIAKGRALVAGGSIPVGQARDASGYWRLYLYDAVRAAPSAERVRALLPLAEELDSVYGGNVLASYVKKVALRRFEVRGPLAKTYARLVADYNALDAQAQEAYFAQLREAGEEDLLLGALVLTARVGEHLEEYQALARESGDPWFVLLAETEQAQVEVMRGDYRRAEEYLLANLRSGQRQGMTYRCVRTEFALVRLYISLRSLREAEAHAKAGIQLARESGDWGAESYLLHNLFEISQLRNARPLAAAYLDETGKREATNCALQRHVHQNRALMHVFDLRFEEARREILETPLCGEPRTLNMVNVLVELDRVGLSVATSAQLHEDLAMLHRQRKLTPAEQADIEYLEGLLLMQHGRPEEGRTHLRKVIAMTEGASASDAAVWEAWIHGYQELAFAAGKVGDPDGTLLPLAEAAQIPLPAQCVVGAVVSGERSVVAVRDHNGVGHVRYEGHRPSPNIDVAHLVPDDFKAALAGCSRVDVLASPLLRGRPELLPSAAPPWVLRERQVVKTSPVRCEPHQLEVRDTVPPPELGLSQPTPNGSDLVSGAGRTVLWGASATPEALLAAMPEATQIFIAASMVPIGDDMSLLLSPGENKKYTLSSEDLRKVELICGPFVFLVLTPAEAMGLGSHTPRHVASTLRQRGARAVFVAKGPVPANEYRRFFGIVFAYMEAGAPTAAALDRAKSSWPQGSQNQSSDWVKDITLFE